MPEPNPFLTVGALRALLEGWPDDRPVMVGDFGGPVRRVLHSCHETVLGDRTVAGLPSEYLQPEPGELPPLPTEPVEALVLRGELAP
ncbi:hypothetical protein [Tsukamurella soli]|uniref:Uncharacterized protein n=1 Tax=Tsukamurella soli TaxID=644556 RepID=A0ABP8JPV3_9ACTN